MPEFAAEDKNENRMKIIDALFIILSKCIQRLPNPIMEG